MAAANPIRDWHEIAVELLMTDADLALQAIAWIYSQDDKETVQRLVRHTRDVYESIQTKRKELTLSPDETAALDSRMGQLQARRKVLGEPV